MVASSCRRFMVAAVMVVLSTIMFATSFDVQARRLGGGSSLGRQSSKAMTAPRARPNAATPAASSAAAAGANNRSGLSRWLGPLAGIAAGLGLAALLSHLGLSAMFANIVANLLLIALLAWAVFFVVRRLRSRASSMHGEPRAAQSAYGSASTLSRPAARDNTGSNSWYAASDTGTVGTSATPLAGSSSFSDPPEMADNRQIPSDFDETRFLQQAKAQFIRIQAVWDSNNLELLRESLTDELMSELATQFPEQKQAGSQTEVVLLNAELLSVETVPEGELASVRFSGMLREEAGAPAVHFEEIWNLLKSAQHGWLLAGIQQISDAAPTPGQ